MKRNRQSLIKWEFKVRNKELEFKSKMIPLIMANELEPTQMMFLLASVVIVKDQWKSFLRPLLEKGQSSISDWIAFKLLSNMYKWFKVLLWDKPMFVKSKLYSLGMIYLSIITPDDVNTTTAFDQFLSFEINFSSK